MGVPKQSVNFTGDGGGGGAVNSVNGKSGYVVLNAADVGAALATDLEIEEAARISGDAATLAAAQSYVDSIDQVLAFMDRLGTTTWFQESWAFVDQGSIASATRRGLFVNTLVAGGTAAVDEDGWFTTATNAGDGCVVVSNPVISPNQPGIFDFSITVPVAGPANAIECGIGIHSVRVNFDSTSSPPNTFNVSVLLDSTTNSGVLGTIAHSTRHQLRLMSSGGGVWKVILNGVETWEGVSASTFKEGIYGGIYKTAGTSARAFRVRRITAAIA